MTWHLFERLFNHCYTDDLKKEFEPKLYDKSLALATLNHITVV